MSAKEIIEQIAKLDPEERQEVAASLGLLRPAKSGLADGATAAGTPNENLSDLLPKYAGTMDGLPEDLAANHDHYLYGLPKQKP